MRAAVASVDRRGVRHATPHQLTPPPNPLTIDLNSQVNQLQEQLRQRDAQIASLKGGSGGGGAPQYGGGGQDIVSGG